MPINFLRKMFRSSDTEEDAPKKFKTKRVLRDPMFSDEEVDDATAEVAADLLAKPRITGDAHSPRDIKQMAQDEGYIKRTDTGARRRADRLDAEEAKRGASQRLVRTGYGGGIQTDDGSYLKFGSDDSQPMMGMKKGGQVKSRGSVSAASKRGDGCATKGKTKGRMI